MKDMGYNDKDFDYDDLDKPRTMDLPDLSNKSYNWKENDKYIDHSISRKKKCKIAYWYLHDYLTKEYRNQLIADCKDYDEMVEVAYQGALTLKIINSVKPIKRKKFDKQVIREMKGNEHHNSHSDNITRELDRAAEFDSNDYDKYCKKHPIKAKDKKGLEKRRTKYLKHKMKEEKKSTVDAMEQDYLYRYERINNLSKCYEDVVRKLRAGKDPTPKEVKHNKKVLGLDKDEFYEECEEIENMDEEDVKNILAKRTPEECEAFLNKLKKRKEEIAKIKEGLLKDTNRYISQEVKHAKKEARKRNFQITYDGDGSEDFNMSFLDPEPDPDDFIDRSDVWGVRAKTKQDTSSIFDPPDEYFIE